MHHGAVPVALNVCLAPARLLAPDHLADLATDPDTRPRAEAVKVRVDLLSILVRHHVQEAVTQARARLEIHGHIEEIASGPEACGVQHSQKRIARHGGREVPEKEGGVVAALRACQAPPRTLR